MSVASNAPDVEVMDMIDAGNCANSTFDAFDFHAARSALQQDVQALTDDADGGPQDHHADADGEGRIDPALSGKGNRDASGDDSGRGQRVADFVHDGTAQVDVAMPAHEHQRDSAIHDHAGRGDPDHQFRVDIDRVQQAVEGLVPDVKRDQDEGDPIDECR